MGANRNVTARVLFIVGATVGVLAGCETDSDVGGSDTTPPGARVCSLNGPAIPLPWASADSFDVAPASTGWMVLAETSEGVRGVFVGGDGSVSAQEEPPIAAGGDVHASANAATTVVVASTLAGFWKAEGMPLSYRQAGQWSLERSDPLINTTSFTSGWDLTTGPDDTVEVVWSEGLPSQLKDIFTMSRTAAGVWSPAAGLFSGAVISGSEIHAAVDGGGVLHVIAVGDDRGVRSVLHTKVGTDGTPSTVRSVISAPDSVQNNIVSGVVAGHLGGVWAAEVHGANFGDGTDGRLSILLQGPAVFEVVATSDDDRPVADGLGIAPLASEHGEAVVATIAHGANNLEPTQSDDDVTLYRCDGAGCTSLVIQGDKGRFYGPTAVAANGVEALVVYAQEAKSGTPAVAALLMAQRVSCQ